MVSRPTPFRGYTSSPKNQFFNIVFALEDLEFRFGLRFEYSTFASNIYHYFATDSDHLLQASRVWATPLTEPRLDTSDAHLFDAMLAIQSDKDALLGRRIKKGEK